MRKRCACHEPCSLALYVILLLSTLAFAASVAAPFPITTTFAQPYGPANIPGGPIGPPTCNSQAPDGRTLKLSGNANVSFFGNGNNNDSNNNIIIPHASLSLRLFDPISNQTMGGVTYHLIITKANSNNSSNINNNNNQTVLDAIILSYPGPLVLNMESSEVGKKANEPVFLDTLDRRDVQHGPFFHSDRNGAITVQDSALLKKGSSYFAHVEVYGVNAGNMNLCPDAVIPKGDFSWTMT